MSAVEIQREPEPELGPAMHQLTELQRKFVRAFVTGKPGHGALTRAYLSAGYTAENRHVAAANAHALSRSDKIIAAIRLPKPVSWEDLLGR